ncbi:hypothetical protein AB5J72_26195 [Streptomyces sp. CG1]|uniref:hypothetical protein n=1 Tax=Streptomyces sp. CG1 TaxID=1287523 RepID=UPI0034E2F90E
MAFVAIYDANVLYPSTLRDILIRIAQGGLVQAKWTDQILDETFRNILKNHPDIPPEKLDRVRTLMNAAIRDCLVKGHESLIDAVELPDPDDRHALTTTQGNDVCAGQSHRTAQAPSPPKLRARVRFSSPAPPKTPGQRPGVLLLPENLPRTPTRRALSLPFPRPSRVTCPSV